MGNRPLLKQRKKSTKEAGHQRCRGIVGRHMRLIRPRPCDRAAQKAEAKLRGSRPNYEGPGQTKHKIGRLKHGLRGLRGRGGLARGASSSGG
jgi:hypothetical protein